MESFIIVLQYVIRHFFFIYYLSKQLCVDHITVIKSVVSILCRNRCRSACLYWWQNMTRKIARNQSKMTKKEWGTSKANMCYFHTYGGPIITCYKEFDWLLTLCQPISNQLVKQCYMGFDWLIRCSEEVNEILRLIGCLVKEENSQSEGIVGAISQLDGINRSLVWR